MLSRHADHLPRPLRAEHDELHVELARLVQEESQIGAAARDVEALLAPHVVREEAFALLPLAILPDLAAGKVTADMSWAVAMARRLKVELPSMLDEHIAIIGALRTLMDRAQEVDRTDVAALAEKLMRHAELEEDVLYPAAILVGEFLAARL